jgi:hypothetical protein
MGKAMTEEVHLLGEGELEFETPGGKVSLKVSEEALTPYGGLVPWAAFCRHTGIMEKLEGSCPVKRTSPNAAPTYDVLQSFFLTAVTDGRRFVHVQRLREDPSLCELFGMKSVVSDDTIRRFFASMDREQSARWTREAGERVWRALPERIILDWDSTVQTKYGHQEGAQAGYNPTKPGRRSFHPLVAVAAGTRLCAAYRFRSGDTVTSTQWAKAAEEALAGTCGRQVWLHRGDIGLGQEPVMAWHEQAPGRPAYLFKLKLTANVKRAMARVREEDWQGPGKQGLWQVAEARVRLPAWSSERRVVFARKLQGPVPANAQACFWTENKHELAAYATSLPPAQCNAWQIQALYRDRGDAENVFDELKNQWGFNGFCAKKSRVSALAAQLLLLVYNLWCLFSRLLEPGRHIEASGSRRWFMIIGAKLVKSGRKTTLLISAQGAWWQQLKHSYQRVLLWLRSTAPQLDLLFSPAPSSPSLNCGI